jgi:alkylated DNA repair dioxygenase AlkB
VRLFGDDTPVELLPRDGSLIYWEWALGDRSADEVMEQLRRETDWEQRSIVMFGREVAQPRLNSWYGDVPYTYSGIAMTPRPWTPLLTDLRGRCEELTGARFNSVLINLYRNGDDSMGWHADDERELGPEPPIASLSLGALRRFRMRHRHSREIVEVDPASGSLIFMSGLSQACWMHEVPKTKKPVDARINLTFRWIHPELLT